MTVAPRSIVVAINPEASFGTRREVGVRTVDRLRGCGHRVTEIQAPDAAELAVRCAAALEAGADALVVVGGDGMVSLGAGLVAGTATPLGIVPSGTGNDAARGLGLPIGDTEGAIARLIEALALPPRCIDAGLVSDETAPGAAPRWFVGAVSAGFDAVVNERANRMRWPRGRRRYTLAILRELMTLRARRYDLEIDGRPETVEALLVSVANNRFIGGGMMIAPAASLDDGSLDLFIVSALSRLAFLRLFPKVFRGAHAGLAVVRLSAVSSVRIAGETDITAYADGERIGPLPIRVQVVPRALYVLA